MRLLVLSDHYPPFYTGGYGIACAAITERLRQRGYEVLVLTSNYGLAGCEVTGHVHRVLHRPQDSASLLKLARWEVADHRTLRGLLTAWQPDLISVWSMLQLFPSLHLTLQECGRPIVFNLHDVWLPTQFGEAEVWRQVWLRPGNNVVKSVGKQMVRRLFQRQERNWLRPQAISDLKLDHIIFCSDSVRARHQASGLPLREHRVIYNGLDLTQFYGQPDYRAGDPVRVLFVGRLVAGKGAHVALTALRHLVQAGYEITLNIAGVPAYPWDYAESLPRLVEQAGLEKHVNFLGAVPNQDLPALYRQHQVLVFPSSFTEGLPLTLLEAMACGLTVVATRLGGSTEILEDQKNSLIFAPDDALGLRDCLLRLLTEPGLAQRLAAAGQALIREKFDLNKIVRQTEDYLQTVTQR